ncbi:MAG: LamG-like jellyroll fold domain-containing protein [Gammaproteobacteria bacterium]
MARDPKRRRDVKVGSFGDLVVDDTPGPLAKKVERDEILSVIRFRPPVRTPGLIHWSIPYHAADPTLITITSGTQGTSAYVDGVLAETSGRFRVLSEDCSGRLVLGTRAQSRATWNGDLLGIAIYNHSLTQSEVQGHYTTALRRECSNLSITRAEFPSCRMASSLEGLYSRDGSTIARSRSITVRNSPADTICACRTLRVIQGNLFIPSLGRFVIYSFPIGAPHAPQNRGPSLPPFRIAYSTHPAPSAFARGDCAGFTKNSVSARVESPAARPA